jgi:hypothetical protein
VAKDAIARLDDVDEYSVQLEKVWVGRITFDARKGKSLDLAKIHAALQATRLSGRTGSEMKYLEITALGEVVADKTEMRLKVTGTKQEFIVVADPDANLPHRGLEEALTKGVKVTSVTGRVEGWSGHFPAVLKALPGEPVNDPKSPDQPAARKPPRLRVTDFTVLKEPQTGKK